MGSKPECVYLYLYLYLYLYIYTHIHIYIYTYIYKRCKVSYIVVLEEENKSLGQKCICRNNISKYTKFGGNHKFIESRNSVNSK